MSIEKSLLRLCVRNIYKKQIFYFVSPSVDIIVALGSARLFLRKVSLTFILTAEVS